MDGAGIAAALRLGAAAAQLGTAFLGCGESLADAGYRAALFSDAAHHTTMTRAISGRPARCLANRFTLLGGGIAAADIPDYPTAYDLGKALHVAARPRASSASARSGRDRAHRSPVPCRRRGRDARCRTRPRLIREANHPRKSTKPTKHCSSPMRSSASPSTWLLSDLNDPRVTIKGAGYAKA